MSTRLRRRKEGGVSLVELLVFIVIIGVAMAGMFAALNTMTRGSADPQVRKQVLAIAESLMDEVASMPFTYCDPDDANAATATSATVGAGTTNCATAAEIAAVNTGDAATNEPGETRYSTSTPFDNVNDYHGFSMSGIKAISDGSTNITGLGSYTASITVTQAGISSGIDAVPLAAALLIRVTVTGPPPRNESVTLEGFRTRYAPNTLP